MWNGSNGETAAEKRARRRREAKYGAMNSQGEKSSIFEDHKRDGSEAPSPAAGPQFSRRDVDVKEAFQQSEEVELIRSVRCGTRIILIVFIVLGIIALISFCSARFEVYEAEWILHYHEEDCYYQNVDDRWVLFENCPQVSYDDEESYAWSRLFTNIDFLKGLFVAAPFIGVGFLTAHLMLYYQVVVTNRRVCIIGLFGAQFDLPMDMISSVGVGGLFRQVIIGSSAGKIRLFFVANADDVYSCVSELIYERQMMTISAKKKMIEE